MKRFDAAVVLAALFISGCDGGRTAYFFDFGVDGLTAANGLPFATDVLPEVEARQEERPLVYTADGTEFAFGGES